MDPQYAQTHREETSQQHINDRQVHQEAGAPPLLTTQANVFSIRNETCQSKCDLPAHENGIAENKPFISKFCQNDFDSGSMLERHLLIHTQEKPYVCKVCNHRFNQKANLEGHMLTHTGKKQYICTICKRSFAIKDNLTQHLLIHTEEKKHMCEICKKCFTSEKYLNRHSENRVCMRKKANNNTEVANKPEVPNPESDLEKQGLCEKQPRQHPQSKKYLTQTVSDHCETTATGNKNIQKQAIITTLGSTENTQSFVPIDQLLVHMVPQFLNHDAQRHHLIQTVEQQNISHSVPHVLRHIGHQISAQIDHQSTLTPYVNQFNIGAQSLNQLITVDQQYVAYLGYQGLAQVGHRTHGQIGYPLLLALVHGRTQLWYNHP